MSDPIGPHQDTNATSHPLAPTKEENARKPMRTATRLKWSADHWSETYRALVRSSRRRSSSRRSCDTANFLCRARNQSGATSLARRSAERSVRRAAGSQDLQGRRGGKRCRERGGRCTFLSGGEAERSAVRSNQSAKRRTRRTRRTPQRRLRRSQQGQRWAELGRAGQRWAALGRAGRVDPPRHPRRPARPLSPSSVPHFVAPAIGQVGGPPLDALRSTRCAPRTMR